MIRRFLLRTLQKPEELIGNIKTGIGGVILKVVYGYTVEFHDRDPLVDLVGETAVAFGRINQPTGYLVDSIPARKSTFLGVCSVVAYKPCQ